MSRRSDPNYLFVRFIMNAAAIGLFKIATMALGISFTWGLYAAAFGVYIVLSCADAICDEYWPIGDRQ